MWSSAIEYATGEVLHGEFGDSSRQDFHYDFAYDMEDILWISRLARRCMPLGDAAWQGQSHSFCSRPLYSASIGCRSTTFPIRLITRGSLMTISPLTPISSPTGHTIREALEYSAGIHIFRLVVGTVFRQLHLHSSGEQKVNVWRSRMHDSVRNFGTYPIREA